MRQREEDIQRALEYADAEDKTKLSFGNVLSDVISAFNPFDGIGVNDEDFEPALKKQAELEDYFINQRGFSAEEFETLRNDATLATGATGGAPTAVDSQGRLVINDGLLVLEPEKVRESIDSSGAPEQERNRAKATLDARRKAIIEQTFQNVAESGGLTWDGDEGDRKNPKLSPLLSLGTYVQNVGSAIAAFLGAENTGIEQRAIAANAVKRDGNLIGLRFDLGFTDEEIETAVIDLVKNRDDALDRARIGVGQGLLNDLVNMVATPFELAGNDFAAGITSTLAETEEGFDIADAQLANLTTTEEFVQLGSRIVPQIILTRKVGNLGGAAAARTGATAATQARVAGYFATGYGGLQSATYNARDVLDNGGTTGEALGAGILGFGTTFLVANGFNKIGAGGVEQFRSKATAASSTAKRQLTERLRSISGNAKLTVKGGSRLRNVAVGALGEGVEEFVDEFINGLITQDYTGATDNQLASNAFKAALLGAGFGGVVQGLQPVDKGFSASSTDEAVSDAADLAAAELEAPEATPVEQEQADAARIVDLREKAQTVEEIPQPDGTVLRSGGLTQDEAAELEALEAKLAGEPETAPEATQGTAPEATVDQDQDQPEAAAPEATATEQLDLPLEVGEDGTVTGVDEEGTPLSEEQVEQRLAEEDPIAVDETEDLETVRDAVFDNLNEMDSSLTPEQAEAFDNRIAEATTLEELGQIEGEMLAAALAEDTDTDTEQDQEQEQDEDDPMESPVNRFLRTATKFQKQEFIRRFGEEGEDALDVIADLSTEDNAELLTDEELLSDEPLIDDVSEQDLKDAEDGGAPVIMYSFIGIPDPALVIKGAKALYKGAKSLVEWSRQMIAAFGDRVRPLLRKMWHDLRRNAGDLKESRIRIGKSQAQQQADTRAEQEFNEDEAALEEQLDLALEETNPAPPENTGSRIRLPRLLPRRVIEAMVAKATGVQNSLIPGLGRAVQYLSLGITKQIHKDIVGTFFEKPLLSWLFGRESARRRALFIGRQFADLYANELATNKDGSLTAVKPKREGLSDRPSDVIENVMEHGRRDYDVSDDFLRMVADWRNTRDRILKDAADEGLDLNFLKDEDGNYDNSKILDNFYFPRGKVTLVESGEESRGPGSARPRAKVRSFSNKRKIASEKEGVETEKYRYDETPVKRIESFVEDVYSRIEDRRLATHPDIVKASGKTTFIVDEQGNKTPNVALGQGKLTLAGKTYQFNNQDIRQLQNILDGQTLNPDDTLRRIADKFQIARAIKFTFDFSAAAIQLAYLWGYSPLRAAKSVGLALAATFGNKTYMRNYNLKNRDLIAERISLGGLYSASLADVDFLQETDSTSSQIRQLLSTAVSPFTNFHTLATEIGANELYAAMRYQAVDKETGRVDPVKGEKIVRFTDRAVGRESLSRNGLRASSRSILSMASAAPGMYGAFVNIMADMTSKDKFTREQALKAHSRFIVGMSMLFLSKAMAAMMLDDEDTRTTEAKFYDALSRLNPKSKKFMTVEVPIGGGRRTVFSEGGFFRGAVQVAARVVTDPGNADQHIGRFLKAKKSPGVGTALEMLTQKDYFGNEITRVEALADAFAPISLNELSRQYRGPAIDLVAGWFGIKGQSRTSLLEEQPELNQTLEQMIFNAVGLSAYTESSRGEFNRQIDIIAGTEYEGNKYRDLEFGQKVDVITKAEERGILKPVFKSTTSYMDFKVSQLDKNLDDPTLRRVFSDRGIYEKVAAIPRHSVAGGRSIMVPIDSEDHKAMYRGFVKDLENYSRTDEFGSHDSDQMLDQAEVFWENQLRSNGY